jgi:cytochrome c oxidase subunit 2
MDDQQDDHQAMVAWILGIAVTVAVAVSLIISVVAAMNQQSPGNAGASAAAPAAAAATAVEPVEVEVAPALAAGPGVPALISFFFETDLAELPADAGAQVQAIVDYAKSSPDTKVGISGFHDKRGDVAHNQELAKRRAKAAREMLIAAGMPEDRIILVKPQETTGGEDDRQARRVDIYPAQ